MRTSCCLNAMVDAGGVLIVRIASVGDSGRFDWSARICETMSAFLFGSSVRMECPSFLGSGNMYDFIQRSRDGQSRLVSLLTYAILMPSRGLLRVMFVFVILKVFSCSKG